MRVGEYTIFLEIPLKMDFTQLTELLKEPVPSKSISAKNTIEKNEPRKVKNKNDIWDEDECLVEAEIETRPSPEFIISYSQRVTTEDLYLGMQGRMNTISHADDLIITVSLPRVLFKDIHLNVEAEHLDIRCPLYRLNLSL
jgi:hypothetical protein